MSDITALFKPPVTVQVGTGPVIEVRELTVGQLARFMPIAAPVLETLTNPDGIEISALLAHAATFVELVAIGTGIEREGLNDLPASDLLRLLEAMIEANAGFFGAALPAFVMKLAQAGAAAMDGSMQSSYSSRTATAGAKSSVTP